MKIIHHLPVRIVTEPVSPAYQAEVDRSTSRVMVLYEQAQRRLAKAELRALRAGHRRERAAAKGKARRRSAEHELAVALELVELRREELLGLERLMHGSPASVVHRGRGAYRPVPQPGPVI